MDLITIAIFTLLLQLLIYGFSFEPARIAFGLPFLLFFPGYVLVSALYPRREQLKGVERVALGLGLSLALVPLLGLALNFTPWGIRLTPMVVMLSLWILTLLMVTWIQRWRIPPEERFEISWKTFAAWINKPRRPVDLVLGLSLTLAMIAVVGAVAWKVQQPIAGGPFTEFYVLGTQGVLQDYPTSLRVGELQSYNVGIVNHEKLKVAYFVRAFLNGVQVGSLGPLILDDEKTWEGKIGVMPSRAGTQQKLELRLYRGTESEVYRTVHLFVDVRQ
jgi:uncharacterized membrane protein